LYVESLGTTFDVLSLKRLKTKNRFRFEVRFGILVLVFKVRD